MTTKKIDLMSPATGRMLGEDDNPINVADKIKGIGTFNDTKTATIALNASQSDVIDLEGYQLAALHMPAAWDTADITFLSAPTADGTFQPLYAAGVEVVEPVAAGRACPITYNALALASVRFIKIRSGNAITAVNQTAARTIVLSLKR